MTKRNIIIKKKKDTRKIKEKSLSLYSSSRKQKRSINSITPNNRKISKKMKSSKIIKIISTNKSKRKNKKNGEGNRNRNGDREICTKISKSRNKNSKIFSTRKRKINKPTKHSLIKRNIDTLDIKSRYLNIQKQ
jgi:hypothetical protein